MFEKKVIESGLENNKADASRVICIVFDLDSDYSLSFLQVENDTISIIFPFYCLDDLAFIVKKTQTSNVICGTQNFDLAYLSLLVKDMSTISFIDIICAEFG